MRVAREARLLARTAAERAALPGRIALPPLTRPAAGFLPRTPSPPHLPTWLTSAAPPRRRRSAYYQRLRQIVSEPHEVFQRVQTMEADGLYLHKR